MASSISKVKIGNLALSALGARSKIEAFTEDSAEASQINLWYEPSREQALEDFDWSFARKRLILASSSEDAPEGVWIYRYQYPADCLKARLIENRFGICDDAVPYEVEMNSTGDQKTILTDMDQATLVYTFNQELTSVFSLYFVKTLSYLLAHNIAMNITGKPAIQDRMLDKYLRWIANAQAADGNESVPREPRDAEWIRVRT